MTFIVLLWLPLCIATGMFASIRRNRNGVAWFLLALIFSPILAFIFVLILERRPEKVLSMRGPDSAVTEPTNPLRPVFGVLIVAVLAVGIVLLGWAATGQFPIQMQTSLGTILTGADAPAIAPDTAVVSPAPHGSGPSASVPGVVYPVWRRAGAGQQEFHRDSDKCDTRVRDSRVPTLQRDGVFFKCMEGKGWSWVLKDVTTGAVVKSSDEEKVGRE